MEGRYLAFNKRISSERLRRVQTTSLTLQRKKENRKETLGNHGSPSSKPQRIFRKREKPARKLGVITV